jgi:hypothetical protein
LLVENAAKLWKALFEPFHEAHATIKDAVVSLNLTGMGRGGRKKDERWKTSRFAVVF